MTMSDYRQKSSEFKPETGEIIDPYGVEKIQVDFFDEPHEQIEDSVFADIPISCDFFEFAKPH